MPATFAPLFFITMQAAVPAQEPGAATPQQIFDAATAAMDKGKCAEAVKGFRSLEARRSSPPAVMATIRLRRGVCEARLGRAEEAQAAIRDALAVLEPLGADHAGDVREGHMTLGEMALQRFDYATAESELKSALALATAAERLEPLMLLARVTMFDDGPQALAYAEEALQILTKQTPLKKEAIGTARTLHARILLNQGKFKEAYDELRDALKLHGGLTLKVNLSDIVTRSDLALAALLNGDKDKAREYLAYTGAGRFEKAVFSSARSIELPLCGGEEGLRPDDLTIVEFQLGDNGVVRSASPIYSTGGREAALEFARAVSSWSWAPEDAAAIPPFFRYVTRVELRCSKVGERPSLLAVLEADFGAWLAARSLPVFQGAESDARSYPLVKAAVDRLKARPDDPARIAPLVALGTNSVAPLEERAASLKEALRLASAAQAPAAVRAYFMILIHGVEAHNGDKYQAGLRQILADPRIAQDAHGGGTVRLLLARRSYGKAAPSDAAALVTAVVSDTRLAPDDPIRIAALLEQASLAARAGQVQAARQAFDSTGLSEQQCALVGLQPALKRSGGSSSDFPMAAMGWGFEGWVRTEFDVRADGRTIEPRAVIAYPPFVFNEAATGIVKDSRYEASYRPSGGAACSGQQQQIQFRLPR